jgi:hypothetical protein
VNPLFKKSKRDVLEKPQKVEVEYRENLYSADYKGERTPLSRPRREWINISSVEEKIDRFSKKKRRARGIEEKVNRLLAKKFKK